MRRKNASSKTGGDELAQAEGTVGVEKQKDGGNGAKEKEVLSPRALYPRPFSRV